MVAGGKHEGQDELRLVKRPKLTQVDDATNTSPAHHEVDIKNHSSYEQVMLDVNRCAGRLEHIKRVYLHKKLDDSHSDSCHSDEDSSSQSNELSGDKEMSEKDELDQNDLKEKLAKLIVTLLIENPDLHYYQGFHDVCLTYMTLHGPEEALTKMRSLVKSHFGIYMKPTMNETKEFLSLIPTLVGYGSPDLEEFLYKSEVGTIFALSWVITWFSHVLPNEKDVEMIFRYLENEDIHMILYLCSEIILLKKTEILELESEMSTVHHYLSQLPRKEKLHFDILIEKASKTFSDFSPKLLKERHSQNLKLKNTHVQTRNLFRTITTLVVPTLGSVVSSNKRTAIFVMILASAIALDRWLK